MRSRVDSADGFRSALVDSANGSWFALVDLADDFLSAECQDNCWP